MHGVADYWNGFGTRDESAYPELWEDDSVGAWAAGLGPSGNILADQSAKRDGTMSAGMSASTGWEVSQGRYANKFDGSDDYFDIGSVTSYSFIQNTLVFGLSWWQKMTSLTVRMAPLGNVLSSGENGFFAICEYGAGVGTNALRIGVERGSVGNPVIVVRTPDNSLTTEWQHIKVTGTGAALQININGVSQSLTTETAFSSLASGNSTRVLNIGKANHSSSTLLFSGWIDDVHLYSRTPSASTAKTLALYRGIAYERRARRSRIAVVAAGNRRRRVLLTGSR